MNAMCSVHHSCLYDVAMIASRCVAVLSYVTLLVLMTFTAADLEAEEMTRSMAQRRFKFAVTLASLTGLTASLPVALALGAHSIASFLVREVSYASAIAIGALCFTAALTSAGTRRTGSGEVGYHESDAFEHGILHRINPASGLGTHSLIPSIGIGILSIYERDKGRCLYVGSTVHATTARLRSGRGVFVGSRYMEV
jgi:hypothetical protein